MVPVFKHSDLRLVEPPFGSDLTKLILELDFLRKKRLAGSTPPHLFFQLKDLFHMLESIGSARIEGNNTTIAEYIETKIEEPAAPVNTSIEEIRNMEKALAYLDESFAIGGKINRVLISELHKMVVEDLPPPPEGEGDPTPGVYRAVPVGIKKASHVPPPSRIQIETYMEELFDFINREDMPQYDLLKIASAHHRFVWIHPFNNGNGRTVRLLTYAMLIKYGFNVKQGGRILNPTAVFCSNRNRYYDYLAKADSATDEGILEWCDYVLKGLKTEIEKIDKLVDYPYLKEAILLPAIGYSFDKGHINEMEAKILKKAAEKKLIQAGDIREMFPDKKPSAVSNLIKKLINKRMLQPERPNARSYYIQFTNNFLLRGMMQTLGEKGFLPIK